ncbi:hypothetical protein [Nocardioides zeae]
MDLDASRALRLYLRATELGHAGAAFTAGVMVLTGEGTAPDAATAGELFAEARDLGLDVEEQLGGFPPALRDRALAALGAAG